MINTKFHFPISSHLSLYKIHMDQELITPENVCEYSIILPMNVKRKYLETNQDNLAFPDLKFTCRGVIHESEAVQSSHSD